MLRFVIATIVFSGTPAWCFGQSSDFSPESVSGTQPSTTSDKAIPPDGLDEETELNPDNENLPATRDDADLRFDDDTRDAELGLSQAEIRAERRYGLAVVLGPSNPWMSLGIESYYTIDGLKSLSLAFGSGDWSMSGRKGQIEYEVEASSRSTILGYRMHLHEAVPMFVTPMVGLGSWRGNLNPSGTDDPNSLSELELLKTGFSVQGLIVGASVGLSMNWESGWFLEYVLINFSQAVPFSKDFTSNSQSAHEQVNRALTRPGSWGLLNLKAGYFF